MAILDNVIDKIQDLNTSWEGKTGEQVEDFICRRLQNSISNFSFSNETSELTGYNSEGKELCKVTVINATPSYIPEIEIVNLRINSNNSNLKVGEAIELNQPSIFKVEAGIRLIIKYDILGKTYYGIDPQKVEFTLGNQTYVDNKVVPNSASSLDAIQYIDITELFKEGISNGTLTASCATKDYTDSDSYEGTITLRKIIIKYNNKGYIEGKTMSFNISGLSSQDASKFQLLYYTDGSTVKNYVEIGSGGNTAEVTLETGAHQIYARVEYKADANLFYSNWVQTNIIIDCKNIQGDAVAVINSVPTEINNCSNALLYKICYAAGTNGGNIVINSYLSESYANIQDPNKKKEYIFNSTTLTLMSGEEPNEKEFYSYFELETVSEADSRFIGFDINGQTVYSYDGSTPEIVPYFYINVIENKYNIDGAFNYTPGANLNYSQINGSGSNVFLPENTNILPGDGWVVDGRYTAYQVSASSQDLFKTPIDLRTSLNNGFTFEFLFKTYNVNSDAPVVQIGNLHIGPGYARVYHDLAEGETEYGDDSIYINSAAAFGREEVTHLLITYAKQYKPTTYLNIYDQLLTEGSVNYSSPGAVTPYNVLKIYVNGVINREIQIEESSLLKDNQFKLQIAPTTSDIKFYGLRTYNFPFNFAQVQKNYISSILDANDKKIFYDKNDILDINGRISLEKCINKYNVIVYAIPETDCPLYYGNKDTAGNEKSDTSILVHYANPDLKDYNVKMWGGKYKAQGSSAKKYLIHNCQYNIKKGKCLTEEEFEHNLKNNLQEGDEGYIAPRKYYSMPGSDIQAKKFVGKVNYASSMQSHKQGACDFYDGAYRQIFTNSLEERMPTGGRKAVLEMEFLYFYYNLKPGESLDTITIKDTLKDANFIGFQTWGPGKTDDPTFGYGDHTPEYILMEGADNGNSGANFKIPWAAFQTYTSETDDIGDSYIKQQPARVTKNDITTGLLISGETIKFTADDDPWDVDYGAVEFKPHYNEDSNDVWTFPEVIKNTTLKRFVDFYNAAYQYDFTCLLSTQELNIGNTFDVTDTYVSDKYPKGVTCYKLYCDQNMKIVNDSSISQANIFDVFRWDAIRKKWVPAGLHMKEDGTTWETFNLSSEYKKYTTTELYQNHNQEMDMSKFQFSGNAFQTPTHLINYAFPAMKEMFIAACKEYIDVDDMAFHQAMIRILLGTDNRAKNTYYQIIGKVYENGEPTEKGDYKIRMMADDMDTIFATDNNGQQVKPYYLLEPEYNLNFEHLWGDQHSSFFYPFDLCFASLINEYTKKLIDYLIGSSASITSESTKLHEHFLRIQEVLPAVAYNHHSEIYYDLAQTLIQEGIKHYESNFGTVLAKFANNGVSDPLSLSHGSTYEGEIEFLKNRLLLFASLTNTASGIQTPEQSFANTGTGDGSATVTVSGKASYIDYFYPNYRTSENLNLLLQYQNDEVIHYDKLFANPTIFPVASDKIIVQSLAVPDIQYDFTFSGQKLTGINLPNIEKYQFLEITQGLQYLGTLPRLPRANSLIIDGIKTQYRPNGVDITVYNFLPVVENLQLTNIPFNNSILDFRNCNRLEVLNLTGCTGINSIILPEGEKLKQVKLPACIKSLAIINNPNITYLELQEGTKLNNLTLNCSSSGNINASELIETYFDFNDAVLLKLQGGCNLDLYVVERMSILGSKCDLQGTYTILDEGVEADISYQLKKALVKQYGNIKASPDNNNKVKFEYSETGVYEGNLVYDKQLFGFRYVQGSENVFHPFETIDFSQGNMVNIINGRLDIYYESNIPATVGQLDSVTGALTLYQNTDKFYNFTVYFNNRSIKATGQIFIGYLEPAVGHFAYSDGTFSPSYIDNKVLVGIVYAKRTNPSDSSKLDLAILSNKTVTGVIAPDFYSRNNSQADTETSEGRDQAKIYNILQSRIFIGQTFDPTSEDVTTYEGQSYSPYSVTAGTALPKQETLNYQITMNYDVSTYPLDSGKTNTSYYKVIGNRHLSLLAQADPNGFGAWMVSKGYMNSSFNVINNFTIEEFENICKNFDTYAGIVVPKGGGSAFGALEKASYDQIIYPAFYKASIFQPDYSDKCKDYYKSGCWYVPSISEMSHLIAHRIKSTTTAQQANDSINDWYTDPEKTTYKKDTLFNTNNKKYFAGFLEDLKGDSNNFAYVTSDVVYFKNVVYTKTSLYESSSIGWKASYTYNSYHWGYINSTNESYSCRRDHSHTVPLCCQITINKNE